MKTLDQVLTEIAGRPVEKDTYISKPNVNDIHEYLNTMAGVDTTEERRK